VDNTSKRNDILKEAVDLVLEGVVKETSIDERLERILKKKNNIIKH
jgi:hypothetical protein